MERVTGIGGLFFRARDPDSLSRWHAAHLGVDPEPSPTKCRLGGRRRVQPSLPQWHPTPSTSAMPSIHGRSTSGLRTLTPWCVSYATRRSRSMSTPSIYPNGRFANLHDPEGNPVQLWQPASADLRGPARSPRQGIRYGSTSTR